MPEIVAEPINFPGRGRRESVDWDVVADGRTYRLNPGEDFPVDANVGSIQSSAHQAAARRGMKARTTVDGASVIVQFYT
jgi:hypothetical protein